jgi:hypothetical protein
VRELTVLGERLDDITAELASWRWDDDPRARRLDAMVLLVERARRRDHRPGEDARSGLVDIMCIIGGTSSWAGRG